MSSHPIPIAALDKHLAFLGATGSGKTSGAKSGVVEPSLDAGERVIVIDPTAAWWGLRLSRTGKSKGYPIYIFGGDHGDYPLRARDAEILAEAFATSSDSAVFDTSLMTVAERTAFFTEFAETLRRKNRGPLKVIIDEAHLFMPQAGAKAGGAVPAMLHAGNNLVSLGRSRGLRITLISQRPAKLHKDSLTQVQSLVAMRLMAPQDRAAISDWVADQADPTKGKEIIASLPTLKPGEAWVWAPQQGVLERVKFPEPRTFDSSRAPDAADGSGPELAPLNIDALKGKLATIEAETKANDPKVLRAEVSRLTVVLAKANINAAPPPIAATTKANLDAAYKHGLADGFNQGRKAMMDAAHEVFAGVIDQGEQMIACIRSMPNTLDHTELARLAFPSPETQSTGTPKPPSQVNRIPNGGDGVALRSTPHPIGPKTTRRSISKESVETVEIDLPLTGPQRTVLAALAWWRALGHENVTRAQVAAKAGFKVSGGHFLNRLSELSRAGLISYPGQTIVSLTFEGIAAAPVPDMGVTVADSIRATLTGPQLKLFDALLRQREMSREDLAAEAEFEPKGGHFLNRLSELSRMQIISFPARGQVTLQEWIR